jgi:hypothetical protein
MSFHIAPRRHMRALWSLAAAAVFAVTAPSPAQFGLSGGIGDAFRPAFTTRDIQLAEEMLNLDEAQRFILETLFDDYQAEFRTGVDSFRDRVANLRTEIDPENPDPGKIMRIVFGTIDEWRAESKVLAEQFVEDLKGLLNEQQMDLWPPFERRLFRLKFLRNGQLPAENLDLTVQVQSLQLDPPVVEELQPLLLEYETALHDALRKREDYLQSSQSELIEAIQSNNYDLGIEVADRQVTLREAVRDVNEKYTVSIAAALPEDAGKDFLTSVREATYPRVYRMIPAQRAFQAAKEIEGLSPETVEAINALEQDFVSELNTFNEHLVQVIRDYEPEKIKNKVEQAASRLSGETPRSLEDPTRDEFAKRNEISTRYMDLLKALLTPEQFAGLPGARRWLTPEERAAAGEATPVKRTPPKKILRGKSRNETLPSAIETKGGRGSSGGGESDGKEKGTPQ